MKVYIVGSPQPHTTARYFERVLADADRPSFYGHPRNLAHFEAGDVGFFVDPFPAPWPPGFEEMLGRSVGYMIDVHRGLSERAAFVPFFDALFVAQKDYIPRIEELTEHPEVHWLPLACSRHLHVQTRLPCIYDVGFVGRLGSPGSRRARILETVLARFQSNDFRRTYSPVEMASIYERSKIVINASIGGDLNMRVFEAMASGSLLVTDRIANGIGDLFQEGRHYIGYSTAEEAVKVISHYLRHDCEREAIAERARDLVLRHHTYAERWLAVERVLTRLSDHRTAPVRRMGKVDRVRAYGRVYEAQRLPGEVFRLMASASPGGWSLIAFPYWLRALGRRINASIPLTSGAVRRKWRSLTA